MQINPIARQTGLVVQEMPDEVLVYDLETNEARCLNNSAATVWRACDGTNTVSDIVQKFEENGLGAVSEDFVWLALDQLNECKLLEAGTAVRFGGRSRREVLKTIGLASIVAVPVIASLVAPQNALANLSCACTSSPSCAALTSCPSTSNCNPSGTCAP